jgi:hypothetical protein
VPNNDKNVTLEDVVIAFRNFAGKEDKYNREGDRNFAILLNKEIAERMLSDGWNVKYLREREGEEGPPQAYIQVAVSYKIKPPKVGVLTSKGLRYYTEDMVELLDWVDIEKADVTMNPYEWEVGGKSGTKAYLSSLFIEIAEDYLQLKWEAMAEENIKQLESGASDIIEGEYWTDQKELEAAK